ncbi:hypothetical protein HPB50_007109 [Hyalomma asiaticum]|uniref:Uncharacterized protein n=1 Tax=Hyalomma asiaticum TaxID=266040 RepID=A0ACB7RUS7_HYAAI|nr:hypothetical protein HPB50_007109 [Hyalomma asiaticum]
MCIRRLTHGNGEYGIKGQVVNASIEVPKLVQCLPRNVPEDAAIDVHFKRRLVNKASYKRGLVKRSNIHSWLKHLETTPLYKYVNVKIDGSRVTQLDGDEAECDEIEPLPEITDDPVQAAVALNAVSRTLVHGVSNNVHPMWVTNAKSKAGAEERMDSKSIPVRKIRRNETISSDEEEPTLKKK